MSSMNCLTDTTTIPAEAASGQTSVLLALGDSFLVDEDFEEAVSAYTAALQHSTRSTSNIECFRILSHRSSAHYNLKHYQRALQDAQDAQKKLQSHDVACLRRGESEVCTYREGLAALALGRSEYARAAFESAQQMAIAHGREFWKYQKHLTLCDEQLHGASDTTGSSDNRTAQDDSTTVPDANQGSINAPVQPPSAAAPAIPAIRSNDSITSTVPKYQYYQSDKFVTVQILEPRVQPQDLDVRCQPNHLVVMLNKAGKTWTVICGNLYDEIVVDRCKTIIKDEKIVIKLAKKNVTYEWPELFGKQKIESTSTPGATSNDQSLLSADSTMSETNAQDPLEAQSVAASPGDETAAAAASAARARPYTSNKDWDKIEKDIVKETEDDTDPTNRLFTMIYANADEDTKRAMIKSYQTSGGTVLSTNWNEVKEEDYEKERTAPKGMEWKTWKGDKLKMKEDE